MKRERRRLQKGKQQSLGHSRSDTSSSSSSDSDSDGAVKVKKKGVKKRGKMPAHLVEGKRDESDGYLSAWELEYEQDETYDGVFDAMGKIFDKEGLAGFYHGVGWDLVGTVSNNVWYFAVCEYCSDELWMLLMLMIFDRPHPPSTTPQNYGYTQEQGTSSHI